MIEYIDSQLAEWPLARKNYQALGLTERRCVQIGDLQVGIQHNPARIVSTAAKTDAKSLASRPCFLCRENRPEEQKSLELIEGWEMLINPFPIFPTHFTIVSRNHVAQEGFPIDMVAMAEKLPGHTIFFNGKRAGASCPDHLHCQAVKTDELPLMKLIEKNHLPSHYKDIHHHQKADAKSLGLDIPFKFISVIVTPDMDGFDTLGHIEELLGKEFVSEGKINLYVWIDNSGLLRIAGVPRNAHRPQCYSQEENGRLISPGSIDMAGVIITPRERDFKCLTEEEIKEIYRECGIKSF